MSFYYPPTQTIMLCSGTISPSPFTGCWSRNSSPFMEPEGSTLTVLKQTSRQSLFASQMNPIISLMSATHQSIPSSLVTIFNKQWWSWSSSVSNMEETAQWCIQSTHTHTIVRTIVPRMRTRMVWQCKQDVLVTPHHASPAAQPITDKLQWSYEIRTS